MMRNDTSSKITASKLFMTANGNIYSILFIKLFVILFIHLDWIAYLCHPTAYEQHINQ
jgi:hypothetical protein